MQIYTKVVFSIRNVSDVLSDIKSKMATKMATKTQYDSHW